MKYKAKEQNGEMAYGQPTYAVPLTENDKVLKVSFGYDLILATYKMQSIMKNLTTGYEKIHEYEREYKCNVRDVLVVDKKYLKAARKQGFRVLQEGNTELALVPPICSRDAVLTYYKKPVPIIRRNYVAYVQADCFADVEAAANYFDERLPLKFYEKYLGSVIELAN